MVVERQLIHITPRLQKLKDRYSQGDDLTTGELTTILHILKDRKEAERLWEQRLKPHQIAFWKEWDERRKAHYEAVATRPWGTREATAEFLSPQSGNLIISLAGGRAPQESYLVNQLRLEDPSAQIGVILIDNNPLVEEDATKELEGLDDALYYREVVIDSVYNLREILTESLPNITNPINQLRGLEFYGRYYPLHHFKTQLSDFFSIGQELGVPTDFTTVVLNPDFNPDELTQIFMKKDGIHDQWKKTEEGRKNLQEFGQGMDLMVEHAKVIKRELPVWYPKEIIDYIQHPDTSYKTTKHGVLPGEDDTPYTFIINIKNR